MQRARKETKRPRVALERTARHRPEGESERQLEAETRAGGKKKRDGGTRAKTSARYIGWPPLPVPPAAAAPCGDWPECACPPGPPATSRLIKSPYQRQPGSVIVQNRARRQGDSLLPLPAVCSAPTRNVLAALARATSRVSPTSSKGVRRMSSQCMPAVEAGRGPIMIRKDDSFSADAHA